MNNDTKNDFLKQGFFFLPTINSDFQFILDVATDLLKENPQILHWIKKDRDKFSKEETRLKNIKTKKDEEVIIQSVYRITIKSKQRNALEIVA